MKTNLTYTSLVVLALVMGAVTAWQASQAVTFGPAVAELEQRRQTLLQTQQELHRQISQQNTLQAAVTAADTAGFEAISKPVALTGHSTVATLQ